MNSKGALNFNVKNEIDWRKIETCYDHTIFKTKEWFDFLNSTQQIEPLVIEISHKNNLEGFFIGGKFKKIFQIVASPFEGWTTDYQGLSLFNQVSESRRMQIYNELVKYLFRNNLCSFFQASDMQLSLESVKQSGFKYELVRSYKLDLTPAEENIYSKFSNSSCKYSIRKAKKNGIQILQARDSEKFASNYYNQLKEVFKRQGLKPTYPRERIKQLITKLRNTDKLLLLEAISPENDCLATGIFVGDNKIAHFWGGASYPHVNHLCPNEILMYEAIRYWKKKNFKLLDFSGIRKFNEKFGSDYYEKPKIMASKFLGVMELKNLAKKTYYNFQKLSCFAMSKCKSFFIYLTVDVFPFEVEMILF